MAITDAQIQDLISKTNIIYNLANNTLNTSLASIYSAVINNSNQIQNKITTASNQQRSDANYTISTIASYINGSVQQTSNNTKYIVDNAVKPLQESVIRESQAVQQKVDAISQSIQKKIDAINAEIKADVTKLTVPLFEKLDQQTQDITHNIENSVFNAQVDIKTAITNTNNIIKNTTDSINSALEELSQTTADNNGNSTPVIPNTGGIFGSSEPAWLTALMEQFYNRQNSKPLSQSELFFKFLGGAVAGNKSSDLATALANADPVGELLKQAKKIGAIEENVFKGKYKTVDDLGQALKDAGIESSLLGGLIQLAFAVANIGELFKAFGLPVVVKTSQLVTALYSLKQLNENDIITALIRNNMSYDDAVKWMDNLGHSNDDSKLILKNSFPVYTPQEIFRLGYLGKFSPEQVKDNMRRLGWNEIDTVLHGYLNQPRPGIQDLISFSVKEVYSPETYTKFGQYQDFPKEFAEQAKLLGLDETYAKQYWAAHWQLPSANMGYDMLHRGIINKDELKYLLKALDVMPYWRDKLINLSYRIVARVDTRRLYSYGIWSKDKVYNNYLKEGYSPEDAADLTNFTVQYDNEQDNKHKTGLQKKAHDIYIKAYNYNLIDKNTTKQKLLAVGYKAEDIDLELSLEDYELYVDKHKPKIESHTSKLISLSIAGYRKRSISRKDFLDTITQNGYTLSEANTEADYIDRENDIQFKEVITQKIQALYFEGLIDDNGVLTQLMSLGFTNSEALETINQLQILKRLDLKKPTPQQFKTAYEDGLISTDEYAAILDDMGYNQKYIPLIIALSKV